MKLLKKDIEKLKVFEFLQNKLNFQYDKNLWIANITSFSLENNPTWVRIRNDEFLEFAKLKKEGVLLS